MFNYYTHDENELDIWRERGRREEQLVDWHGEMHFWCGQQDGCSYRKWCFVALPPPVCPQRYNAPPLTSVCSPLHHCDNSLGLNITNLDWSKSSSLSDSHMRCQTGRPCRAEDRRLYRTSPRWNCTHTERERDQCCEQQQHRNTKARATQQQQNNNIQTAQTASSSGLSAVSRSECFFDLTFVALKSSSCTEPLSKSKTVIITTRSPTVHCANSVRWYVHFLSPKWAESYS